MFYHLYQLLKDWDIPGLGMFQYISFRQVLQLLFHC